MTEFQIDGIAAVTGAGQGIGLGVVGALAERGFDVLALVLEPSHAEAVAERVAGAPGTATVQVLDVTDIGDFAFPGNLQVLVNNAGIRMSTRPVEVIDSREWRRTMDVNFFGMVDMTRLALPIMRANGGGVICNVGSGGQHLPNPFLAAYRASKGAVSAFCESLRVEVAPFGIRVIEIMPGAVKTGINVQSVLNVIADTSDEPAYLPMAQIQRRMIEANPPETVSPDQAGQWVANAIFDVDGPMRYGTCAGSQALLEMWRTTSDEVLAQRVLSAYQDIIARPN